MNTEIQNPHGLDEQEAKALCELLEEKYQDKLNGRSFHIDSRCKDDILELSLTLKNKDESFYYPIECRMDLSREELSAADAARFLVDYIDGYLEEYFWEENEDLFLHIDWSPRSYDAVDFQIRGQVLNMKLEREAESLLFQDEPRI